MKPTRDPGFYKVSYDGFEALENFPTVDTVEEYRELLLKKTELQSKFITRQLGASSLRRLRVLEIGSGNGRLLVSLALHDVLDYGLGVEISQSRVAFANRWLRDLDLRNVDLVPADALSFTDFPLESFDLCVCITGTFNYFSVIKQEAPLEILQKLRSALNAGGQVLLEIYQMTEERRQMFELNNGKLRLWQELPAGDRFAYYLDDFEYWEDVRILRHRKIFVARDGRIDDGRVELLSYCRSAEIVELLEKARFKNCRIWGDYDEGCYEEGRAAALVMLADCRS